MSSRLITDPTWPEPGADVKPDKKRTRLGIGDLRGLTAAIDTASKAGIGTFHVPDLDNLKVKYDSTTGEHYIWAELL